MMASDWRLRAAAVVVCACGGALAAPDPSCFNTHTHHALLMLLPDGAAAATAVQSGAWSDPATWGGATPQAGEDVRVPAGVEVVFDAAASARVGTVRVDGVLRWATDRDTTLFVDTLFSSPGGEILIGTEAAPVPAGVRAEVVFIADEPASLSGDPEQLGRGFIPHGRTRVVGADKTDFAALAGDAMAGANSITLREPPVGWAVGDTLVLGGTSYDENGSNADNSRFRDEVLRVTAIDGAVVSFENTAPGFIGLQWDHVRPSGRHFEASDLTLYVANLTRNVVFRSELDPDSPDAPVANDVMDKRRGHIMAMHTPDVVFANLAMIELGRANKNTFLDDNGTNVDGTPGVGLNTRGRYALHLHRNLPPNNAPIDLSSCTPAVVRGCSVWGSPGWGIVHHDSFAVFEDNVVFDVLGSAFVQEAGNEVGVWRNNLSIKTTGDDDPDLTVEPFGDGFKRVTNFDFGFNGEAYWIQGAGQVEFIGNIAVSAAGGGANVFSDVDGNSNRDRTFVPRQHLPAHRQAIVTDSSGLIAVNRVPMNTFRGFEVYNSDFGLITWNHMRNQGENIGFTCPCDGNIHRDYALVDGFKFWNIYGQGVHLQYSSQIRFVDGLVASSDLATPGVDDKPRVDLAINGDGRGFGFGMNGPAKRLELEDVAVEGWRFGVRTPLEGQINRDDDGAGTGSEGARGLPLRRSVFRDLKLANNDAPFYRRQNGFTNPQPFPNFLVVEGGDFEPVPGNQPPVADFSYSSLGGLGVVRLDGRASFDLDTPGDGLNANSPLAAVVGDENYILAYAWDLDGDGVTDAFGEEITARFEPFRATEVTLTVWDHAGVRATITKSVTPAPTEYSDAVINGGFDGSSFVTGLYALGSQHASMGWADARANIENGRAVLRGQFNFSSIGQSIYDDFARRGEQRLSFRIESREGHASPSPSEVNRVFVRVFGINGEHGSMHREAMPEPAGAVPVEIVPLFEEQFAGSIAEGPVERSIDLGPDGFQYLYIGFQGEGVSDRIADDFIAIDDVRLMGPAVACSSADLATPIGSLTFADITAFLDAFAAGDPAADFAAPAGSLTFADVAAFLTAFSAGCP